MQWKLNGNEKNIFFILNLINEENVIHDNVYTSLFLNQSVIVFPLWKEWMCEIPTCSLPKQTNVLNKYWITTANKKSLLTQLIKSE